MNDAVGTQPVLAGSRPPAVNAGQEGESRTATGIAASLALHAALLVLAFSLALGQRPPAGERPVSVEILTPQQFEAMTAPPPVAVPAPVPPPAPSPMPAEPSAEQAMIRPKAMLSAGTLADPRSREARALLSTLDDTERMIQLCGLEAMEQVHAWRDTLRPTAVVAYAMAEAAVSGDRVDAGGAAFRSGGAWYGLSFECRLRPDHAAVSAFAFKVGALVPKEKWEAFNLPAEAGPASD
jgi:cell division septation protein DedD